MNEEQLERYGRHILLPEIDIAGQEKLLQSRILIIGMGGLGAPAAIYLASSGIGHLVICDDDEVELNNLQRQIIHTTHDIGRDKVASAHDTLRALNPDVTIHKINKRLDQPALHEEARLSDVVIDASDNFDTRFKLNAACVSEKTPLVSGAISRMAGQVIVFHNKHREDPCYRCLYPDSAHDDAAGETCQESGVLAPVAGIIGSIMAIESLKLLLHIGDVRHSRLFKFDALQMTWRSSRLSKDPECPVCSRAKPNKKRALSEKQVISVP
jgi:molybdopterin/thiamine biosynthesis adenylyltransferase